MTSRTRRSTSMVEFSGLDHIPLPAFVLKVGDPQPIRRMNALADRRIEADPSFAAAVAFALEARRALPPHLEVTELDQSPTGPLVLVVERSELVVVEREFSRAFELPLQIARVGCQVLLGREKHEIAESMKLTERTVSFYVHRLLRESGHVSRLDLAARQPHWGIRVQISEALRRRKLKPGAGRGDGE